MGTPIKRLLSPRIASSVSPIQCTLTKNVNRNLSLSPIVTNVKSHKALKYETPNSFLNKNFSIVVNDKSNLNLINELQSRNQVKVNVTDYTQESLLVNTPNKKDLSINGLCSKQNLKILGKGTFGIVVRGIYKDTQVAVKVVNVKSHGIIALGERNAINFSHVNIIKTIDIISNFETNYAIILMEYIETAQHLQCLLEQEQIPFNQQIIVKYALDISKGLQYCHENGVLHLDIKPYNILVSHDSCKICDFGNSIKIEKVDEHYTHQGTVAYTAPELLMGKQPTAKCDVYSLGILLWQMKYRETPYLELDSNEAIIYKVVKFDYRPKLSLNFTTDKYTSIFMECWSRRDENRPVIDLIIDKLKSINSML